VKDKQPVPNQQVAKGKDPGNKERNIENEVMGPSEMQLADRLFAAGEREEAVRKYKVLFAFAKKEEQAEMLTKIVELETAKGNLKEAKRWIESGLDLGLTPKFSTPGATGLLAEVQADRDQKASQAKKEREFEEARLEEEAVAKENREREEHAKRILADLRSDSAKVRREAIKGAGDLGQNGKEAAPLLVAILADKEDRQAASNALVRIGKPAVPDLIKGLNNKNQFVRLSSAHSLGRIGSDAREAIPMLMERARSDTSINVREAATGALEKVRK